MSRRTLGLVLLDVGACLLIGLAVHLIAGGAQAAPAASPAGQEEAPNRREFTITARDYRFTPYRLEVTQDDLTNSYSLVTA